MQAINSDQIDSLDFTALPNPNPTIFLAFATGFAASQSFLSLLEEGEDEGEGGELSVDPHPYPLPQMGEGALCRATPIFCRIRANSIGYGMLPIISHF